MKKKFHSQAEASAQKAQVTQPPVQPEEGDELEALEAELAALNQEPAEAEAPKANGQAGQATQADEPAEEIEVDLTEIFGRLEAMEELLANQAKQLKALAEAVADLRDFKSRVAEAVRLNVAAEAAEQVDGRLMAVLLPKLEAIVARQRKIEERLAALETTHAESELAWAAARRIVALDKTVERAERAAKVVQEAVARLSGRARQVAPGPDDDPLA